MSNGATIAIGQHDPSSPNMVIMRSHRKVLKDPSQKLPQTSPMKMTLRRLVEEISKLKFKYDQAEGQVECTNIQNNILIELEYILACHQHDICITGKKALKNAAKIMDKLSGIDAFRTGKFRNPVPSFEKLIVPATEQGRLYKFQSGFHALDTFVIHWLTNLLKGARQLTVDCQIKLRTPIHTPANSVKIWVPVPDSDLSSSPGSSSDSGYGTEGAVLCSQDSGSSEDDIDGPTFQLDGRNMKEPDAPEPEAIPYQSGYIGQSPSSDLLYGMDRFDGGGFVGDPQTGPGQSRNGDQKTPTAPDAQFAWPDNGSSNSYVGSNPVTMRKKKGRTGDALIFRAAICYAYSCEN